MNRKLNNAFISVIESIGFERVDTQTVRGYKRYRFFTFKTDDMDASINVTIFSHSKRIGYMISAYVWVTGEGYNAVQHATDYDNLHDLFKGMADARALLDAEVKRLGGQNETTHNQ